MKTDIEIAKELYPELPISDFNYADSKLLYGTLSFQLRKLSYAFQDLGKAIMEVFSGYRQRIAEIVKTHRERQ